MEGSRDTSMAEVAMQYTDSYSELMLSFANNINTTEGGTHETGFKAALTRVLNDYGKKYKLLKDDESFKGEDAREGLTAIISVKLQEAQFEGQTKTKLGNSEMRALVVCAASNRPSCSSRALSCSNASCAAPIPSGNISLTSRLRREEA